MLIVVAGTAPSVETYDLTSSAQAWTLRNENFLYTERERIGTRGVTLNNVFHVTGNNWSEEYYLISSSQAGTSSGPGSPRLVTGDLSHHSEVALSSWVVVALHSRGVSVLQVDNCLRQRLVFGVLVFSANSVEKAGITVFRIKDKINWSTVRITRLGCVETGLE